VGQANLQQIGIRSNIDMADTRHRRIQWVALLISFVLGAVSMQIYRSLDLGLRERATLYVRYFPPWVRLDCPTVAPSPIPRFEAASAVVRNQLFVFGGFETIDLRATTRSDRYDPATNSWTRIADLPEPVTHAGIAVDGDYVWIVGGFVGHNPGQATDRVWRYDTRNDRWEPGPSLPQPRASAPLVRHQRSLHYFGGLRSDRRTDSSDHWRLDLDSPTAWTPRAPLPDARNHLGGVELDGMIYAIGGQYDHDGPYKDVAAVHGYDPVKDSWRELAPLPDGRSHFEPGTFTANGKIVIVGGRANRREVLYEVTAYDPKTNRWQDLVPTPVPTRAPTAQLVGERVLIGLGGLLPTGGKPRTELKACTLKQMGLVAAD
jgi:N-acetylneuraminic acid mutarotase